MVQLAVLLTSCVVLVFGGLYWLQWHRLSKRLSVPVAGVPTELLGAWKSDRLSAFLSANAEVVAAGTVSSADAIFHLSRIDPSVIDAVDRIYEPDRLNSFRDIVAHLEAKKTAGEAAWDGTLSSYKGALGETLIASELRGAGHHVELAADTSNPGFDALVDGQPVQFKAGLNPESIFEHQIRFPDIPVITVAEHSETFAGNPMVTCLSTVSGETVEQTTSRALEGAIGIDDFVEGVPLVTALVSGIRHFRPCLKGQSDLATAAKYTLADTTGIGVGGAAGAKIGAVIGMGLGPIGAMFGAAIGGVAGALSGRFAAGLYKNRELVAAKETLSRAMARYPDSYVTALQQKQYALQGASERLRGPFRWESLISPSVGDVVRWRGRRAFRKWARSCSEAAARLRARVNEARASQSSQEELDAIARQLLTGGGEPFFSADLKFVAASIAGAERAVTSELKKLGRA
jgi:hypothetical protein